MWNFRDMKTRANTSLHSLSVAAVIKRLIPWKTLNGTLVTPQVDSASLTLTEHYELHQMRVYCRATALSDVLGVFLNPLFMNCLFFSCHTCSNAYLVISAWRGEDSWVPRLLSWWPYCLHSHRLPPAGCSVSEPLLSVAHRHQTFCFSPNLNTREHI